MVEGRRGGETPGSPSSVNPVVTKHYLRFPKLPWHPDLPSVIMKATLGAPVEVDKLQIRRHIPALISGDKPCSVRLKRRKTGSLGS